MLLFPLSQTLPAAESYYKNKKQKKKKNIDLKPIPDLHDILGFVYFL